MNFGDFSSISAFIATTMGFLPQITAFAIAIWTVLRVYDLYLSIQLKRKKLNGEDEPT